MSDNDHTGFGGLDQSEYDALAELFLGDSTFAPPRSAEGEPKETTDSEPTPSDSPRAPSPRQDLVGPATVELVILGHLPVRAGLWLKAYAAFEASEQRCAVALLRLAPDIASVDLIGADSFEPHGQAPTFSDAVRRARIDTNRFVLRVNETAEPALAESQVVDRVTILTGADEAALVASYRLVKSLASAWDRRFEIDEGPELRLAIMGSDPSSARAAADKLHSATASFLQRPVEILTCASKIGSAPSVVLFRGEADENVTDLISIIRPNREDQTPTQTPAPTPREPDVGLRLVGLTETGSLSDSSASARDESLRTAAREPDPIEEIPEIVVRRQPQEPATNEPAPSKPIQGLATRGSLASKLRGLITLESVCPHAARVEFAAANDGSLHLVTESRGAQDQAVGIERLVAAAAWARDHFSLLLRAEPALAIPDADRAADHGPTLHLLVDNAPSARALLDTEVRIHLCRPVETGTETIWLTDDLN